MRKGEEKDVFLELGGPFICGNDYDSGVLLKTLKVKQISAFKVQTRFKTFGGAGETCEKDFTLVKEDGRWRIADVTDKYINSFLESLPR